MSGAGETFALGAVLAASVISGCEQRAPAQETPQSAPTAPATPADATPEPPAYAPSGTTYEVAVYSLSRGKGVPEAAFAAHAKVDAMLQQMKLENHVLDVKKRRIGIEGERRTCATFATQKEAEAAAERIRSLAAGAALLNVVMEPCAQTSVARPLPQGEQQ